jgi:hypothetical protein
VSTPGELPPGIREVGESKFIKQLIYAMWGVGKTVYVGSGGPRSLILRPPTDHTDSIIKHFKPGERPKEWIIHDWDEMDEAHQYLRLHGGEWEWVWLDSLSLWQDTGLDDIWQAVIERNPARNAKHAGMDKGEYGRNMDRISAWVRNTVAIDTFNLGITCFPTMKFDAPGGDRKLMPWVQGTMMSEKICGYMTMVGYMEVKKSKSSDRAYRVINFGESEDYYAKDQYGAFQNGRFVDPTIPRLMAAVAAAKGTAQPARRGKRQTTAATSGKKRRTT